MTTLPFIPKEDPEIPDHYGATVYYVNGKKEDFELASHTLNKETGTIEMVSSDDLWSMIPVSSIQRIAFDKRMSKLIAIKEKNKKETLAS